jgi:DNA-binding PadR family transcriptional regulator
LVAVGVYFSTVRLEAQPGARRIGSADLQLLILALLEERPCDGYELIKRSRSDRTAYTAQASG